ncbi:uncharacterized protein [Musca autumnalis]|uniref:uncharacterized protein n=1 Tax=Musca autumnalis TaxID=221902 RepID=UPI003CE8B733
MDRWQNKIAVVTGASSGIGAATCKALVEKGMIVVGLARRFEKMENQTRPLIATEFQKNFHTHSCDVSDEESVKTAFSWIVEKFGAVDVLINNAGMLKYGRITDPDSSDLIKNTINTNVLGVVWCTREAFKSMKERNFDGHIVILNSIVGHVVPIHPMTNVYPPSKHAVTAMTEVLRQEFLNEETKIKITSISPGIVRTEIFENNGFPDDWPALTSADIADAIVYCLQTPPHVQIHEMIIKPVGEKIMEKWRNKVAVVTGASAGIGAACAKALVDNGMIVIGLARRAERIVAMRYSAWPGDEEKQKRLHSLKCDVRQESEVVGAFEKIVKDFGPIAVLINNAGIIRNTELVRENNTEDIRAVIDTNVMGVAFCTREAFKTMSKNADGLGHVININSIAGHRVIHFEGMSTNMYPASKHAITAMTEVYRNEFLMHNTKLRVTSISPGAVRTEVFNDQSLEMMEDSPFLQAADIADAVIYCLQTPPHVQIHELTIKPIGEKF